MVKKKGQKNSSRAPPPPSFGQCPKENIFFRELFPGHVRRGKLGKICHRHIDSILSSLKDKNWSWCLLWVWNQFWTLILDKMASKSKVFQKSEDLPKIWKSFKNLKIFQKSENLQTIWKSSKNLKIFQKSENLQKIWKSSKNLKIFKKIWKSSKYLKIFKKSENLQKIWKSSVGSNVSKVTSL